MLVLASPTYKATYTGLLKVFLDRLGHRALAGKYAIPLLVMGGAQHALAVEIHFRPLLVELGAIVPTPGLAVLESQIAELRDLDAVLKPWAEQVSAQLPLRHSDGDLGEPGGAPAGHHRQVEDGADAGVGQRRPRGSR